MNEITDDVMERLAPAILSYADSVGIPHSTIATPGTIAVALVSDGVNHVIHVTLLDDNGPQLLMRLHPATHGLLVVDGELVVDTFEV